MSGALPGVEVVGLGATTPVGLDVPTTETSVRAGLVRFTESGLLNRALDGQVASFLAEHYLPPLEVDGTRLSSAWIRMLRLSTYALAEACAGLAGAAPLLLALPEDRWGIQLPSTRVMMEQLARQTGVRLEVAHSRLYRHGGAGGLMALRDAMRLLSTGQASTVIVGGLDTFNHPRRLAGLDSEDRLRPRGTDGFIPGEAASFLLLSTPVAARRSGLVPLARITRIGVGAEQGHRYSEEPYLGDGLAHAVQALFAGMPGNAPKVHCVFAGFNGESLPTKEWGVAYLRNAERFQEAHRIEHPADCVGDAGAALGPLMLVLAAERLRAGLVKGPTLVWSTSDLEARAAALLLPA
ncbi:beta-ketoacyl synthase N-terminal-like domain-containing protein [Corallococcus terminator]